MNETYPRREPFFAHRFVRLLTKTAAAQELGPEVAWLLTVVAHQEDAKRYTGAVFYWNEQLMPLCGFGSKGRLVRARDAAVAAGWLCYLPGGKGQPGRYWCMIPEQYRSLPDGACDEDLPFQNGTQNGTQNGLPEQASGNKTERQTDPKSNGKRSPFYPIPKVLSPTEESAENETSKGVMTFPVKRGQTWELDRSKLAEWTEAYPTLDVLAELKKAAQWLRDNCDRQKTPHGMSRFLGAWLARAKPSDDQPVGSSSAFIMEEHTRKVLAEKRAAFANKRKTGVQ